MFEKSIVKDADLPSVSRFKVEPLLPNGMSTLIPLESDKGDMEGSPGILSTPYCEQGPLLIEPSIVNKNKTLKL